MQKYEHNKPFKPNAIFRLMLPPSFTWEVFQGKENEKNWSKRDEQLHLLINHLRETGQASSSSSSILLPLRLHYHDIINVIHSARTQLVLRMCNFIQTLATTLDMEEFDPLVDITINGILRVCAGTKRIVANAGEETLLKVFSVASHTKILGTVHSIIQDKNALLRQRVLESLLMTVKSHLERWFPRYWMEVEPVIIRAIGDASPAVRSTAVQLLYLAEESCRAEISLYDF